MPALLANTRRFLRLIRYPNLLIMGGTQWLCAAYLTEDPVALWKHSGFILTFFATILIGAGGYIINDIFDMEADQVNKPRKIFITPANKNLYAQVYYALNAAGVLLGLIAGWAVGLYCLAMAVLLFYYSFRLKKIMLWGNIAVAVMTASVLVIIGFAVPKVSGLYLAVYAGFAFLATIIREIIKDIEDMEGDGAVGDLTLPVLKGETGAKRTAFLFSSLLVAGEAAFAVWCLTQLKLYAFYYLALLVVIPTIGLALLIYWAQEKNHYSQASLGSKIIMVLGLLSMYFIF